MAGKMNDLTGQKFNRLTVIGVAFKVEVRGVKWLCKCECGNETTAFGWEIKKGKKKSCGCYNDYVKRTQKNNYKHGMRNTRFYRIWHAMKRRCVDDKNELFRKYYIEKGIKVCDEWKEFINFKNDMYESYLEHVDAYGEHDTTIDRIESDGNYCKDNCKWATRAEQNQNRSNVQKAIGAALKAGEEVPGCSLVAGKSVRIK